MRRAFGLILLIEFLVAIAAPVFADTGWYNSNWGYREKITIYHTKVEANLTNFPVLVSITDPDLRDTVNGGHVEQSDGGDILFTKSDGTTKLDHEIEKYNNTTGELIAWVEVDYLSSTIDTDIYIYYGNAICADQWNINGTWDFNYKMVQHLQESCTFSGCQMDSTSNANKGTPYSGGTITDLHTPAGKIEGADYFDGTDDYVEIPHSASLDITDEITIEAWVKPIGLSGFNFIVSKHYTPAGYTLFILNKKAYMEINADLTSQAFSNILLMNKIYYIVGTFNSTHTRIYINGSLEGITSYNKKINISTQNLRIGSWSAGCGYNLSGTIDEIRISDVSRSAEWIKTSYNNQSDPSSFYSVSNPSATAVPAITEWGMIILSLLLAGTAIFVLRRRLHVA